MQLTTIRITVVCLLLIGLGTGCSSSSDPVTPVANAPDPTTPDNLMVALEHALASTDIDRVSGTPGH